MNAVYLMYIIPETTDILKMNLSQQKKKKQPNLKTNSSVEERL